MYSEYGESVKCQIPECNLEGRKGYFCAGESLISLLTWIGPSYGILDKFMSPCSTILLSLG